MTADDPFSLLADTLLPGRAPDWPAASDVVAPAQLARALGPLTDLAAALARSPEADRHRMVRSAEAQDPQGFAACLGALTDAYYGTAPVAARCAELADKAPQPVSGQWFDPALLARQRR